MSSNEKTCTKCKKLLDRSCFYNNKRWKDGLDYYCKNCRKIANKQSNKRNSGTRREIQARYLWRKRKELAEIAAHKRKIEQQQKQYKQSIRTNGSHCLYFIGSSSGAIKIGTSSNLKQRFEYVAALNPLPVTLLGYQVFPTRADANFREGQLHRKFEKYRLHHEWYKECMDVLASIPKQV